MALDVDMIKIHMLKPKTANGEVDSWADLGLVWAAESLDWVHEEVAQMISLSKNHWVGVRIAKIKAIHNFGFLQAGIQIDKRVQGSHPINNYKLCL